ncbi:hypothetical protein [Rhodoferax ferrireducens]|uniref:hypothetical protein n=1 Tax=Rhodoferax ferrireducens TaxID=192843 RepID=UPI000E0D3B51|nr:hypothetical protein [Rhodoferax ferrireducens]
MNGSGESSADQPSVAFERWWQSVTLAELAQSSAVIDEFTRESTEPPAVSPEQFARAAVLQMLCIDAGVVDELIARADARNAALVHALELDEDGQKSGVDAFESWLTRRRDISVGLKTCVALLSSPLREAVDAKVDSFIQATTEHQNILFTILFGRGLQKPVVAPSRASFRKPIALKSRNGTRNQGPD